MATKTSNTKTVEQRKAQVKGNVKTFHDGVLKTSEELLNGSVKAGAKWQELIATAIKKSEPVAEKNIDILFDTAEKVKVEVETGANRVKDLFGIEDKVFDELKDKIMNNDLFKRFKGEVEEIVDEVVDTDIAKKVRKVATQAKVEISDVIVEIKEDALEAVEAIKDTVTDKPADNKSKTKAKTAVTKDIKAKAPNVSKATAKKTAKADLKAIKGIGPKLESILNEAGVHTYADLVARGTKGLQEILNNAGSRYKSFDPSVWIEQAKAL